MSWILPDLLMFGCSVVLYITIRWATRRGLPVDMQNLANFTVPLPIFLGAALLAHARLAVTAHQLLVLLAGGVILGFLVNIASLQSIKIAPNPGYSLLISKSYVILTAPLAVPLLGAHLTVPALGAIIATVAFSALICLDKNRRQEFTTPAWLPLAFAAMVGWATLSLLAKYLFAHGVSTLAFLTYFWLFAAIAAVADTALNHEKRQQFLRFKYPMLVIGFGAAIFNICNFTAIRLAPNVGYVNATNAASIGAITVFAIILFKDEFSLRKLIGIAGAIASLVALFIFG